MSLRYNGGAIDVAYTAVPSDVNAPPRFAFHVEILCVCLIDPINKARSIARALEGPFRQFTFD